MRRHHPAPRAEIPISLEVYHQLIGASLRPGSDKELWEIAAEAIDEWMRRHDPDAIPLPAPTGYQWKSQFLPDGTLLRTVFGGKNYTCRVEGDRILHNGQSVSPSGFVNAIGGTRRNAWRCTWILLPESKDWKLADTLRIRVRARPARKLVAAITPAAPAQSDAQQGSERARVSTGRAGIASSTARAETGAVSGAGTEATDAPCPLIDLAPTGSGAGELVNGQQNGGRPHTPHFPSGPEPEGAGKPQWQRCYVRNYCRSCIECVRWERHHAITDRAPEVAGSRLSTVGL